MDERITTQGLFRREVLEYTAACERLLASGMLPFGVRLSPDEMGMLEYYMAELRELLTKQSQEPAS